MRTPEVLFNQNVPQFYGKTATAQRSQPRPHQGVPFPELKDICPK